MRELRECLWNKDRGTGKLDYLESRKTNNTLEYLKITYKHEENLKIIHKTECRSKTYADL